MKDVTRTDEILSTRKLLEQLLRKSERVQVKPWSEVDALSLQLLRNSASMSLLHRYLQFAGLGDTERLCP